MKTIHKSVLIWFSAEEMFALVTDVARYPEFLPWCETGKVLEQTDTTMTAEIGMSLGGFRKGFTTHNVHIPGRQVKLELVNGPFKQLNGRGTLFHCWIPIHKSRNVHAVSN
jgi:ribosome-associated toxin RatA of RatAB toxin-antitoxin module